jgi:hypothetical protein
VLDLVSIYRGRVVDVASSTLIVEVTGSTEKIDNFIELMQPYGIKEVARSGAVALVRGDEARIRLIDFEIAGEPEPVEPPQELPPSAENEAGDTMGTV